MQHSSAQLFNTQTDLPYSTESLTVMGPRQQEPKHKDYRHFAVLFSPGLRHRFSDGSRPPHHISLASFSITVGCSLEKHKRHLWAVFQNGGGGGGGTLLHWQPLLYSSLAHFRKYTGGKLNLNEQALTRTRKGYSHRMGTTLCWALKRNRHVESILWNTFHYYLGSGGTLWTALMLGAGGGGGWGGVGKGEWSRGRARHRLPIVGFFCSPHASVGSKHFSGFGAERAL